MNLANSRKWILDLVKSDVKIYFKPLIYLKNGLWLIIRIVFSTLALMASIPCWPWLMYVWNTKDVHVSPWDIEPTNNKEKLMKNFALAFKPFMDLW